MDTLTSLSPARYTTEPPHCTGRTVAIYVGEDSSALDVAAIASVFGHANSVMGFDFYRIVLMGAGTEARTREGVFLATLPIEAIKGAGGTVMLTGDPAADIADSDLSRRLLAILAATPTWCAVDAGVLAFARLGLLRPGCIAVRLQLRAQLAEYLPKPNACEQKLFACDGKLWSCPGGAPVSDMCLEMVERELGMQVANTIAHRLLVAGRRTSEHPQLSPVMRMQSLSGRDHALATLVAWIDQNLDARFTIPALAERVAMSERTFHRRFKAYTGLTPLEYISRKRRAKGANTPHSKQRGSPVAACPASGVQQHGSRAGRAVPPACEGGCK